MAAESTATTTSSGTTTDQEKSSTVPQNQRIYIGGMDPNRGLKPVDVVKRLKGKLKDAGIQLKDLSTGSTYFQFTAVASTSTETPLPKIKSWFHNVTWKGCKLSVEQAKPHFLQRLQEERSARNAPKEIATNVAEPTLTDVSKQQPQRRHWKVKRSFGEAVHHVDTQPCEVKDWAMLSRIRRRHVVQQEKEKQRVEKQREQLQRKRDPGKGDDAKRAQKLAYYNRSIHLRFVEDAFFTSKVSRPSQRSVIAGADSSSASSDDQSTQAEDETKTNSSKYEWSDDDSSSASDIESESESTNGDTQKPAQVAAQVAISSVDDVSLADEHNEARPTGDNKSARTPKVNSASEAYAWSDDQSSESSDDEVLKEADENLDDFAGSSDEDEDEDESVTEDQSAATEDEEGLQRDVETNLDVLSQLFPEFAKQQPEETDADFSQQAKDETKAPNTTGWGSTGQMLRFDPSNLQSTNQFVLDEKKVDAAVDIKDASSDEEDDSMPMKNRKLSDEDSSSSEDDDVAAASEEKLSEDVAAEGGVYDVYEQGKLEQVFKEAREPAAGQAPVLVASSSTQKSNDPAFSFGFALEETNAAPTNDVASPGTFSFGFSLQGEATDPEQPSGEAGAAVQVDDDCNAIMGSEVLSSDPLETDTRRKRSFDFPNEKELDDYVHHFYYNVNDGERIIKDPVAWRHDPDVKEQWMKERFTLTQDWKRKRKYALSKKKRRLGR